MLTAQADTKTGSPASTTGQIQVVDLNIYYGRRRAVAAVSIEIYAREVLALIGPSGCGKSSLLRCLNRMHETVPGGRAVGHVLLDGEDIYHPEVDLMLLRRRVGMVFQMPTPLRTRSIYDNVVIGLRLAGVRDRATLDE